MTAQEFFEKVAEMRKAQKDYFKVRDVGALLTAKQLEREIDAEIKRVEEITDDKQLKLF